MVVLWQKKHLANIPTSRTPTSANSSEWTQQNQTLAEKRCCGSIQHTESWGTKPFSPPCLGVSLLLLGNRVFPNYPGSQLLPFSGSQHRLKHITQYRQHTSHGLETKNPCSSNLSYCIEFFLPYPSVILTGLRELVPPELDLCPVKAGLEPCVSIPEGMVLANTKLDALQPSVSASWLQLWISMR